MGLKQIAGQSKTLIIAHRIVDNWRRRRAFKAGNIPTLPSVGLKPDGGIDNPDIKLANPRQTTRWKTISAGKEIFYSRT